MASGSRAFAQKLSKANAHSIRERTAAGLKIEGNSSTITSQIGRTSVVHFQTAPFASQSETPVEPVDYEEFVTQQHRSERDPLAHMLEFPKDDLDVSILPRKIRTVGHILPEEPLDQLDANVKNCIDCYTSDYVVVQRRYQQYSSSVNVRDVSEERLQVVQNTPRQEFEIDEMDDTPEFDQEGGSGQDTPRGSWASFDLRNSESDAPIVGVLDSVDADTLDTANELKRMEQRPEVLFALYPAQMDEEMIERRMPARKPTVDPRHRILVQCNKLELNLQIEPIFASMALYDAKERKKVSENFYFDMNTEQLRSMLHGHIPKMDYSTQARSCIFDITSPSPDLFLVVKLEKVLQGDINEAAEPYLKDTPNIDKVRATAYESCGRLGKYRMPFAWTAIWLQNIIKGRDERDSGSDAESSASNSLDRKTSTTSFDQFRKKAGDTSSLTRRGSVERKEKRTSWAGSSGMATGGDQVDVQSQLDSFPPVTLTVSSFFKQEPDRLKDDDLYKFLQDLKRPSPVLKRLKCIRGTLKLDISVAPEQHKYSLTPELAKLIPDSDMKARPTKEILEFPPREAMTPNYQFRNLLYVCPKELNFSNRSGERARNIAIKIQFMAGEDEKCAQPVIFGKSSCPEFTSEVFTAVTYHNKNPEFYEEVKMKLPSNLRDYHHILFTFYHISCQGQRKEQVNTETPVGYTWIPIFKNGSLQTGLFDLPVMLDPPPPRYSYIATDAAPPGTKWVDNKKTIFSVELSATSTVHPMDPFIDPFLNMTASLQLGQKPMVNFNEKTMEDDLLRCINNVPRARLEPLVRFLPLLLDKLLLLMVKPPTVAGRVLNVGQSAFYAMAAIVNKISTDLRDRNDRHGRNSLLTTYVHYQANLPHLDLRVNPHQAIHRTASVPVTVDDEVGGLIGNIDRVGSMRNPQDVINMCQPVPKLVHEQLALQWSISSGQGHDHALAAGWFFLELMVKAMIEHLATLGRLNANRKSRFSEQFHDDITNLVSSITSDITTKQAGNPGLVESLNSWLAFFLQDLLSVMDRGFVFALIRTYMKDTSSKASDQLPLWNLQQDFIRIICSHEHFIALNLPSANALGPHSTSGASSPTPSIRSTDSLNSFIHLPDKTHWAELTNEFRRQHFLVGLVLSNLANAFEQRAAEVHARAVNAIRNLMTSHDMDPRYAEPECRARVALLYLPLVSIIMDNLGKLYSWSEDGESRIIGGPTHQNEHLNQILNVISDNLPHPKGPIVLKADSTRHLLACFLWVIKNVDKSVLRQWWSELTGTKLQTLLEIMRLSISAFQYKGKRNIRKQSSLGVRKSAEMKARLEDMILGGQGSARQELMQRSKKDKAPPSPNPDITRRWHKSSFLRPSIQSNETLTLCDSTPRLSDPENEAHIEGNLTTEASMLVLDSLEVVVQVVSQADQSQGLLASCLRVLLHALGTNQSTFFLQHLFAVQRSFVFKFPGLLFDDASEHCADLCLRLLRHCSSPIPQLRSHASASLYLLMRQNFEIGNNFARVKMQVTMSLSSLVGTYANFNEEFLRKALKTILVYAEQDHELSDTSFPEQVQDLVFNLHMILSDTVKMKEYQDDPEMLMDLMYRIAKGYQNSPDLRLTWLESMAKKHEEQNHHAESGMCKIHCAALISEYLHMLEDRKYMPTGAVTFSSLTPNALEESAVSDDVVSPDEEGICAGKKFTEAGLMTYLDEAARHFSQAGMYETVNEVFKPALPIAESNRDFKKLADIHKDLHDAFQNIHRLQGKRIFGTYFRVGFYGNRFGDLDGEEYIYKEKALAKLPEIAQRLENFYGDKFGRDNVIMIKDSKMIEISKLNPDKAYIQVTYVEPYFDNYELRERVTTFERNFNIIRFIFATPFTTEGNAHGELHEQFKRKTILTTTNHFPYVKTRIQVVDRKMIVLTPIEVAIEDIQKKTQELEAAIVQVPPDPKILQMVLQGCIGTTVNQGPMEVANVFLKDLFEGNKSPTKHQNKLRLCFKDFIKKCNDALKKNRKLITVDQKEYQKELEKNYARLEDHLSPLFNIPSGGGKSPAGVGSPSSSRLDDLNEQKVTSPMI